MHELPFSMIGRLHTWSAQILVGTVSNNTNSLIPGRRWLLRQEIPLMIEWKQDTSSKGKLYSQGEVDEVAVNLDQARWFVELTPAICPLSVCLRAFPSTPGQWRMPAWSLPSQSLEFSMQETLVKWVPWSYDKIMVYDIILLFSKLC